MDDYLIFQLGDKEECGSLWELPWSLPGISCFTEEHVSQFRKDNLVCVQLDS